MVNPDDVFKVLEKYKHCIFENGVQKGLTDSIWDTLTKELEYKIPRKTLYISILKDSHSYKSKLLDLPINEKSYKPEHESETQSTDSDYEVEKYSNDYSIKDIKKKKFKLTISYKSYCKMEPKKVLYKNKNGVRAYNVLKQNAWSDIINDHFLKKYKLPCNFVYKHCKVNIDSSRSSHFLIFDAVCKDCNNSLRGWSDTEPQKGCSLEIKMLTRDTRGQELKHNTKRHLKGLKHKIVAKQMVTDIASNWRRNQASLFQFDRTSPPNLYHQGVLRKAKQEIKTKH